jgi:hypothetical protein
MVKTIDLEILMDLQTFSASEYEKVVFGITVCMCAPLGFYSYLAFKIHHKLVSIKYEHFGFKIRALHRDPQTQNQVTVTAPNMYK